MESKLPSGFEIDGVKYESLEAMPPQVRQKVEAVLDNLKQSGLQLPKKFRATERNYPLIEDSEDSSTDEDPDQKEADATLPFKLILGLIFLIGAIIFLYLLISSAGKQ